jgi:hypothetical protein
MLVKKLFVFIVLHTLFVTYAFSSNFPRGCTVTGYAYKENNLILNEKGEQAFFLVQNRSNKTIELEHVETKDVFMSPKLHSKLEPLQWAAFAADELNIQFKCFIPTNLPQANENPTQENSTLILNCGEVLDVCQYPRAKFALSNMGNYWVSTNKALGQVIKDASAKGIYLRW